MRVLRPILSKISAGVYAGKVRVKTLLREKMEAKLMLRVMKWSTLRLEFSTLMESYGFIFHKYIV